MNDTVCLLNGWHSAKYFDLYYYRGLCRATRSKDGKSLHYTPHTFKKDNMDSVAEVGRLIK